MVMNLNLVEFKNLFLAVLIAGLITPSSAKIKLEKIGGFDTEPGKELNIVPGTSWLWQLKGKLKNKNVKVYDIDLIDNNVETFQSLQSEDKIILCYFSAGTAESFRADFDQIPKDIQGNPLIGFKDEFWLDIRDVRTLDHVKSRLDLAVSKGCNAVEPDNVDAYQNNSGFPLTADDQIVFNKMIANEAHNRGLSVALKNALELIPDLVDDFNFAVNEQCEQFNECDLLDPFIVQNKAVFQAEYKKKFRKGKKRKKLCKQADETNRDLLFLNLSLNGKFRKDCPAKFRNLPND